VPNEQGWLWCQTLGFWLGTWEGTIDREPATWLRFYDEAGNLVPLPEEAAQQQAQAAQQQLELTQQQLEAAQQQAQSDRQRAETLAARLREMGVDPDALLS
jgi:ribosomal protein S4